MKSIIWMVLLACGIIATASATLVDFRFPYEKVVLKNGRTLENVVFSTYNTATGRVGAVAGGRQAMTLRLADLPDDVIARIRERVPPQSEDEIQVEKVQKAEDKAEAKRRARELEKRTLAEAKANRDAQRKLDVKKAEVAIEKAGQTEAVIAKAAKEFATHYFTYEADPHSSAGYVFNSNVILEDPEPVSGWNNRWRVRGKVGVQYLTRNIGAVGRNTKEFDMLIDVPAKGKPKLVGITISGM